MQNRFEQLLKTEGKQAIAACTAENFVEKIEKLYAKWQRTWAKDIGDEAAASHCEAAKAELLECAGEASDKNELSRLVTAAVAGWPAKSKELMKGLLPC